MKSSYIALGYQCNHNCINCPLSTFDRLHGQLKDDIIHKHIEELSHFGEELSVTISGGEPTLNPNFFDVLKVLGENQSYITILSNAVKCKNMDFVDQMIETLGENYDFSKFHYITALHSSEENLHDQFTGVSGSFLETIQGIENMDKRHLNVIIKHIMNKKSAPHMKDTIQFVSDTFSNNVGIQLCSMDYSGRCRKNLSSLYISNKQLQPYVENALDSFERKRDNCGRSLEMIETPLCLVDPYYWKYYRTSKDGDLTYIAPNNETFDNRSVSSSSLCNTNYIECLDCDVRDYCSGVWESTYDVAPNKDEVVQKVKVLTK